jgi:paraquat-inducible protein B
MKHRNALLVGSFVIMALLLVVVGVLWLSGNRLFANDVRAAIFFQGSVRGLYVGAPVTFRGVATGQVDRIGIEVNSQSLVALIPVTVRLQPEAVHFTEGPPRKTLDIEGAVKRGLRAQLVDQSFVTGQKAIDLDFDPETPARLVGGQRELPEIPALAERFGALIDQVAELPLQATVTEMRATLKTLESTLQSTRSALDVTAEELTKTARGLTATASEAQNTLKTATAALLEVQRNASSTLASVNQLSNSTRDAVLAAQPELQRSLTSAREAAEAARLAMDRVSELSAPGANLRGDLEASLRDLSQAARGLRDWSELLEQQPNAIIFGGDRP